MKVFVEVNSYFNRFGAASGEVELPHGSSVADLLLTLGIPQQEVGFVIRKGTVLRMDDLLFDGDSLGLLPFAVGG